MAGEIPTAVFGHISTYDSGTLIGHELIYLVCRTRKQRRGVAEPQKTSNYQQRVAVVLQTFSVNLGLFGQQQIFVVRD
jgi:hypothetical protein